MAFDPETLVRDYGDIDAEVAACRSGAALFDFSFVARGRVQGPLALASIAHLTHRPMADLDIGRIRYTTRQDTSGHVIADLTVWRLGVDVFEIMSGREEDIALLVEIAPPGTAEDLTREGVIFALQGPGALAALTGLCDVANLARVGYYGTIRMPVAGIDCLIGRLGYTGEAGFEIIAPLADGPELWTLLSARARPAGFAAADILRIEAGFVLFANEFRLPVTAAEAGLAEFSSAETSPARRGVELICFSAASAQRPVLWQPPHPPSRPVTLGELAITSACHSPIAGRALGLAFITHETALRPDTKLFDPTGRFAEIRREARPFYDPAKNRPRAQWRLGHV